MSEEILKALMQLFALLAKQDDGVEANEIEYWLELLHRTEYLTPSEYQSVNADCSELCKILITIVKNSKQN